MPPTSKRRVVVTGLGPISPIGIGKNAFWQGLLAEKSAIRRLTKFDTSELHAKHAAELSDFDPAYYFPPHRLKRLDFFAQLAVASAKLAIEDSGLDLNPENLNPRAGTSYGSALGGIANAEYQHRKFLEEGNKAVAKALALQVFGGSAHSNVAIEFGLQGPGTTNSNSCASGNVALADACRFIWEDTADIVVAGGVETPLSPLTFSAFDNIKTMSRWLGDPPELACRPFDALRDGFVMAEGAASFVIEEYEHAKQRGARIYGEILGFSLNNEAHHMTSPKPGGEPLLRAVRQAFRSSQVNADEIDYINAHASSTTLNDENESQCMATIFNGQKRKPLMSGTKAYTGHALGAAGAVEAAICLLAMEHQWAPPTLHLENPSPDVGIDLVAKHGRETMVNTAMNNSFGFGGINSCVLFRKV